VLEGALMEGSMSFVPVQVSPPGREWLSFSIFVPSDWQQLPPSQEPVDLNQPAALLSLFGAMMPGAAIVLAVGARPAFSDGTVMDWARFLAGANGLDVQTCETLSLRNHHAVRVDCIQNNPDLGRCRIWGVFVEDGQRLYNITAMAPEQLFGSVLHLFAQMLMSFEITDKKRPTATLSGEPEPVPEPITHPKPDVEIPKMVDDGPWPSTNPHPLPATSERPTQASDVALSDDASSFDPAHPMNAQLRDKGVGFVPNILTISHGEKFAIVAAGAIMHQFQVPFGWHVIDDGRRTLIFDAGGRMQINLSLRGAQPGQEQEVLEDILIEIREASPNIEHMMITLGGWKTLALRNVIVDGEPLQQAYIATPVHIEDLLLITRVTANDQNITLALNAAEVILRSLQQPEPEPPPAAEPPREAHERTSEPVWWSKALALEQSDRLEEAEQAIRSAIDHAGRDIQVAHLYELRMQRKLNEGDRDAAVAAFRKSLGWMYSLASGATSGGEGAAYMYEVKRHRAHLVSLLGFDPGDD
jgi:hypothetical protein